LQESAFFEIGKHNFISKKPYDSIAAYLKALYQKPNVKSLELALSDLEAIPNHNLLPGHNLINRLLLLGLAAKFPGSVSGINSLKQIKQLTSKSNILQSPIIIVAGGCSKKIEVKIRGYKETFLEVFCGFEGTIISGGTLSGISGLVGEIQQKCLKKRQTIGYVPQGKCALVDKRYSEIRFTDKNNFSFFEPLQYWTDIIASGIRPEEVTLLGINGGKISSFEYKLGLTLGSRVALVEDAGLEIENKLLDTEWRRSKNLIIFNEIKAIKQFIGKDNFKV
jgi:hypothetical protein